MELNAVQRAMKVIGDRAPKGISATLATQIAVEVNYWTLRDWVKTGVVPTTKYAVRLSEACGGVVSVRELAGLESENGRPNGGKKPKQPRLSTRSRASAKAAPTLPATPAARAAA